MIGPSGFQQVHKVTERPAWGESPIRCGKTKCKWRGYETDLLEYPSKNFGHGVMQKVCPLFGCDNYMHMTEKEIGAWNKSKGGAA